MPLKNKQQKIAISDQTKAHNEKKKKKSKKRQ